MSNGLGGFGGLRDGMRDVLKMMGMGGRSSSLIAEDDGGGVFASACSF